MRQAAPQWIILSLSCAWKKRQKHSKITMPLRLKNIAPGSATGKLSRGVTELQDRVQPRSQLKKSVEMTFIKLVYAGVC